MSNKLSKAELGRRWGLSRECIRLYCKEVDPMPLDSEDVALAWLTVHHPGRAAKIIEAQVGKPDVPVGVAPVGFGELEGDGIEVLLARSRQVEFSAWQMLENELNKSSDLQKVAVIEARTKHYSACAAARQVMEERYCESRLKSRQTVLIGDVLQFTGEMLVPIQTALNSFPYAVGPLVNPTDPEFSIGVLSEQMDSIRRQLVDGLKKMAEELGE